MPKEICLFYREHIGDYVINLKADNFYDRYCLTFPRVSSENKNLPPQLLAYLISNYGKRPTLLHLDEFCGENHYSGLEDKLRGTKIELLKPRSKSKHE